MKIPQVKQGGREPGTNQGRSVRFVRALFFLSLVSALLVPPPGHSAGKEKMTAKIGWPPEAADWTWDQNETAFEGDSLYNYIDGAAEVYLAYNFQSLSARRYTKTGHPDIIADVYRMGSAEDAFGVFSLEQQDPEAGIGQGSEFGGSLLRFWKGPYFVTVLGNGTGKELEAAVLSLGRELAQRINETGQPPRLLRYLPKGLTPDPPDRVCFIRSHVLLNRCFFISHQNILRLGTDVQALLARYPRGPHKLRLLLIRYPTPAKARSAWAGFRSAYLPEAGPGGVVRTEDGSWTKAERYQRYVLIIFGAQQQAEADVWLQTLLKNIRGDDQ
jgi:hypothetical protein